MSTESNENLFLKDDESEYEDFDGDDTMENMLDLFIFHREDAKFMDWFSFLSFIIFLFVNVGCVSFNLYKAITVETDVDNDMFSLNNFNSNSSSVILDKHTKILYFTEFSVIAIFGIIAIYHYICLYLNPLSKSALSGAANFTRLVREFSCFTLVPLFNINTLTNIYTDIAETFEEEKKKYSDRSELWDGIWGVGTKDVQKTNSTLELGVENEPEDNQDNEIQDNGNLEKESRFKKFKRSKTFLRLVSIFIYIGFIFSFLAVILLAFFAFVALYIKTRHVGNFIIRNNNNFIYKWFNFITFIMNIASLSQQSPAIKLIIYQLKVLTKKAHSNEYRRRKQNRIKENPEKFDADKEKPGIQAPKIIIHRKKIQRSADDTDIRSFDEDEIQEIDADKLSPPLLSRKTSDLSTKSANSL